MSLNNITISRDKLRFLVGMLLRENNFEVIELDLNIETYTPKKTTKETPSLHVSDYVIFFTVDYNNPLHGDDPSLFLVDFAKMLSLAYKSVSTYIIGNDGKITTDTSDAFISDPIIETIDYVFDNKHTIALSFYVTHETE